VLSPGSARAVLAGYGLAGVLLGYVTLFYIIGSRYFGVWAPADVIDYSNAFSTSMPWIYALVAGLSAAALEEFFFRLLAISLLLRWFGKRWLAVLLPAVVWALLHANYPVEPIYTRGVELTIAGVVFGLVFLRFGIWSTIAAHYAVNVFLVGYPMMRSSSPYFHVSGMVVVGVLLLPVLMALTGLLRGRHAPAEDDLVQQEPADPVPPDPMLADPGSPDPGSTAPGSGDPPATLDDAPSAPAEPDAAVLPESPQKSAGAYVLEPRVRMATAALGLAGLLLLVCLRTERFGERTLELSINRTEAVAQAGAFCEQLGLDLQGYSRTAWFYGSVESDDYVHLVRHEGVARADTLASAHSVPWIWMVRWFKPEQKEEIQVGLNGDGQVAFFRHQLPESQAGADISEDDARQLLEQFIVERFGRDVTDSLSYSLLESRTEKQEARTDHHFVWERVDAKVEAGEFRLAARLNGDQLGAVSFRYKAPEEFLRELHEMKAQDIVPIATVILLVMTTLVLGGVYFFRAYRDRQITWRLPLGAGILATALMLLGRVNGLPAFYRNYDTSQALPTFLGFQAVGWLAAAVFTCLGLAVVVALGLALFRAHHPQEMAPSRWASMLRPGAGGTRFWLDVILLGSCLRLLSDGCAALTGYVSSNWLADYLEPGPMQPPHLNGYLPLADGALEAAESFVGLLIILTLVLIWQRAVRRTWLLVVAALSMVLLMETVAPAQDWYHFGVLAAVALPTMAAEIWLVIRLVRFNLLAYLVYLWIGKLLAPGWALTQTAEPLYQVSGGAMVVLAFVPLLYPLIACLRQSRSAHLPG
jgi:membrane protease YdiL (CAAX protease family)